MSNYGIENIESLSFKDGIRQRIQMYLGSSNTEGIWQGLKEIINNSTDEALGGYGKEIIITVDEKNQIFSVRDFGRSVPWGIRENGENVLVSIFSKAHTGGKFNHKSYAQSTGCNGIGASATCLSAYYFVVKSFRDGKFATARWEQGENTSYEEGITTEKTGTYIEYRPDEEVFKDAEEPLSFDRIISEVENISYLNSGIKFVVKSEDKERVFYSENGIADFIANKITKPLMKAPIICAASDDTDEVQVAFIWTGGQSESYVFVNGGYCNEGGMPITGAKTTITTFMKKFLNKDTDADLIRKGLVYAINCKVANPSFEGQTKSKINNTNLRKLTSEAFKEGLEQFSATKEFNVIVDMITKMQKAEKAAEKARSAVLNSNNEIQKELKKKTILAEKLADCKIHDESSQLMLCEGKSAKGALVKSRNSLNTACFDLRGMFIASTV